MKADGMANSLRPNSLAAFGAAIRRQRQACGMTLDTLAAATAISKPYLSNIETGRTPGPPSTEKLERIAAALALDADDLIAAADWLRTPESVRRTLESVSTPAGEPADDRPTHRPAAELTLRSIPLINRVAAGKASTFTDLDYPAGIADDYVAIPDLPEAPASTAFAVRVLGESMLPEYREGEILIVGPADTARGAGKEKKIPDADPIDGRDCVVRLGDLDDYATTFKRVHILRDEQGHPRGIRLVPLNPAFPEREVTLDQVTGIYPLIYRLVPPASPTHPTGVQAPATKLPTPRSRLTRKPVPLPKPEPPEERPTSFTTTRASLESD